MKRISLLLALALAVAVLAPACGSDDGTGGITVSGAWSRKSPMVTGAAAVYLDVRNTGDVDDQLVAASVAATVAEKAELHETVAQTASTMMGATTMPGAAPMMTMKPVEAIDLPAGKTVQLKPGGYHIMLLDVADLRVGSTFDVTLEFANAEKATTKVEVRAQ